MRALVVAVLVGTAVLAGCPAHVQIDPPPPPAAPPAMRAAYYEQHAPAPVERGELEVRTRLFHNKPTFVRRAMHLQNGLRVAWVEDLRPLVPAGSAAAKDIDASLDARGRADLVTSAGLAVAGAGILGGGGLLAGYLTQSGLTDQGHTAGVDALTLGAGAALLVGVGGGSAIVAWGMTIRDEEEDARLAAFNALDGALREKLALPAAAAAADPATRSTPTPPPTPPQTPPPAPAPAAATTTAPPPPTPLAPPASPPGH